MKKFFSSLLLFIVLSIFGAILISGFILPRRVIMIFGTRYSYISLYSLYKMARTKNLLHFLSEKNRISYVLIVFSLIGVLYLIINPLIMRALTAKINKRSHLHGSARWMSKKDLKKSGLIEGKGSVSGVVLAQTYDAKYKRTKSQKAKGKKKKQETQADYEQRMLYASSGEGYKQTRRGNIIRQMETQHTLIVGSTRSGKGINNIIPTELSWPGSLIVVDPKSEGWAITSNFRSRFSYTFKFEPENPEESIHYNPLLGIRRGKLMVTDAQNLSYILIPRNEAAKDQFWDDESRRLFTAIIMYVLLFAKEKTFATIYSFFTCRDDLIKQSNNDDDELPMKKYLADYLGTLETSIKRKEIPTGLQKKIQDAIANNNKKELKELLELKKAYFDEDDLVNVQRVKMDFIYFMGNEDKQLNSVLSTMNSHLLVIADPNVQKVTDRSDFTMEDFMFGDRPISLYLCASLSSLARLSPLIKIFFEQAITLLTKELKKPKHRLQLIFDEFRQLGKMEIVEKALSLSAGYGVLCTIAIQSYEQLKLIYQSEGVFTDNFAYQVILRVNDPATASKVEQMLGKATEVRKIASLSGTVGRMNPSNESIQVQETGRSLLDSQEIRSLPYDEALVIASGEQPYRAKKIMYYLDDRFRKSYLDKDGHVLPIAALEDNYPHRNIAKEKEMIEKNEKVPEYTGIDNEGYFLLTKVDRKDEDKDEEQNETENSNGLSNKNTDKNVDDISEIAFSDNKQVDFPDIGSNEGKLSKKGDFESIDNLDTLALALSVLPYFKN